MFRPCIDIKDLQVVQLEQGDRLALSDERSPLELAQIYKADGLVGGHIIDLQGGGNAEVILPALSDHILQVGGGLNLGNGAKFLDAGATHLIFSSAVFKKKGIDWPALKKLKNKFGKKHLVLAPDVKNNQSIYVDQWKTNTGIQLQSELLKQLSEECDELLIHSIEVEGMMDGIDWNLAEFLAENRIQPITYAGGGKDIEVVEKLHEMGLDITIGRAYFSGDLPHQDLVDINRKLLRKTKLKDLLRP